MKPKLIVAVAMMLLCFCGLASTPVFAQSPQRHAVGRNEKLIAMHQALMLQVKSFCSTEECAKLLDEGSKLTSDAKTKLGQHAMTGEDVKQFHAALKAHIRALQLAIMNQLPSGDVQKAKDSVSRNGNPARFVHAQIGSQQCTECDSVYKASLAICALYTIVSPAAAALCIGAASIGYINCLDDYCYAPYPVDGGGGPGGDDCDRDPNGCDYY
jgi:hypothetical protein